MSKIKKLSVFILVFLLVICTYPQVAAADTAPEPGSLYSKSCALTDGDTGRLLYGKDEETALPNASTTKIMTCILALENCEADEVVTFSEEAAAQPKVHLGAAAGEQFYLKDLLYAMMLESYNDCAYAVAEYAAGSAEAFAEKMNGKAKELGCKDTYFVTPNGLDGEDAGGEHHTTAYDLCLIMRYCAFVSEKASDFLEITQTKAYSFYSIGGSSYTVSNTNAFLDMMDGVISGKTGYTAKAGYCYVAALESGGKKFVIALLACGWPNNRTYRWADAKTLFSYGLTYYSLYRKKSDSAFEPLTVGGGYKEGTLDEWGSRCEIAMYEEGSEDELTFLMAEWESVSVETYYDKNTKLPISAGDVLGSVTYSIDNVVLYSYDICSAESVFKWDFRTFYEAVAKEYLLR